MCVHMYARNRKSSKPEYLEDHIVPPSSTGNSNIKLSRRRRGNVGLMDMDMSALTDPDGVATAKKKVTGIVSARRFWRILALRYWDLGLNGVGTED